MENLNIFNKKMFFIDFESNKKGETFLLGVRNTDYHEILVINETLKPICDNLSYKNKFNIRFEDAKKALKDLFNKIIREDGIIVAYSTAELNLIQSILPKNILPNLKYINLARVAKTWKNKYHKNEFDNLPEFRKNKNKFIAKKMSLASIMRLLKDKVQAPSDYGPGKTTARISSVINGLKCNDYDFQKITPVQKQKATKLLKHNYFDVFAMEVLLKHIISIDISCFKKGILCLTD